MHFYQNAQSLIYIQVKSIKTETPDDAAKAMIKPYAATLALQILLRKPA
jgi:hypothetical protein